ncbi:MULTISPECIES: hypothetical protein [unclassified Imperialibacter]|uniref:hypothetical protein n=1 Tax=unclassified Imperialibacter TaxID=2629706 RepID=UPI00125BA870|nr:MULTISPECIES: hypothetical protein [unclassified Imperialibacter]CAD5249680.1 exported hypothetical protein [Imperialibacter sp. 89]CAD5264939.1 exported hypothetical protein [Imperialibacter sp. 75]VVT06496.1 exported hypothetical protein [Imperialibacter sp. EC-SDR9]
MKVFLNITLLAITLSGFSQPASIYGIYQLDTGPTLIYLELRCDSTFHFITHFDFNAAKDYSPELTNSVPWKLANDSTLILDDRFTHKKATFKLVSSNQIIETRKKDTYTWAKVINYNSACLGTDYSISGTNGNRTVHHLVPGKQLISTEYFQGNSLVRRVTYFELSEEELNTILGKRPIITDDPVNQVLFRIYTLDFRLPILMEEEWKNTKYKVTHFNKQGEKVKRN